MKYLSSNNDTQPGKNLIMRRIVFGRFGIIKAVIEREIGISNRAERV